MTNDDFVDAFESGALPPQQFNHHAHVRLGYCYLKREPFLEACISMRDNLRKFAARIGKASLYHETITVAFMSLLYDRMQNQPDANWQTLIAQNSDLLDRQLLARYYKQETLASAAARARFVMSDMANLSPQSATAGP